jgi:2,5-dihydroxypyridine 5,6-dioxygenase
MTTLQTTLLTNFARVLSLSAVKAGEQVVIIDRWGATDRYRSIAATAAEQLGASVTYAEVADPNRLPDAAVALLNAADLVIDLAFVHDSRIHAARANGTRVLAVLEPPEVLNRLVPGPEDKAAALAAVEQVRAAKRVRVTSKAGTDLAFDIGDFRVNCQYGFADTPGKWDQWPGTFVSTFANEGSGQGRVVLDRGDMILFPFHRYFNDPLELTVADGFITGMKGGVEAELLRAYMDRYETRDAYALSHLGWGLSGNARWEAMGQYPFAGTEGQDGRAFAGNFLFSTGPNASGGGNRKVPCHIDMPMRGCTIELDGRAVVVEGAVV